MDEKTRKHGSVIEMQAITLKELRAEISELLGDLTEINKLWEKERELRLVAEEKWLGVEESRCTCGDKFRHDIKIGGTC